MRKLPALLIITVCVAFVSCSGPGTDRGNLIIVAGKIDGLDQGTISVRRDDVLATAEIHPDGSFHLPFSYYANYYFQFRVADRGFWLYLDPGDSIHISAHIDDFGNTFSASGDKSVEAEYMVRKEPLDFGPEVQVMTAGLDEYFEKKNEFLTPLIELVNELEKQSDVDPDYLKLEKAYIELRSLQLDLNFPMSYRMRNNIDRDAPIDFPEDETKRRLENLDYSDPLLLRFGNFRNFANRKMHELRQHMMHGINPVEIGPDSSMIYTVLAADSLFIPEIRDFMIYEMLRANIGFSGPANARRSVDLFTSMNKNPYYAEKLNEAIAQWDMLSPGSLVPDFTFTDIDGNSVRLSDLSGKLIYIDIWATWCGPCIAEHPHWNRLIEKYVDNDIAFLAISIDESPAPWEKMVRDKEMKGYNWYAENAWQSEIATHFLIRGIPRFILLDRERRIIDATAGRPSGNISELLDQHI